MDERPQTRRQVLRWGLGAGGLLLLDPLGATRGSTAAARQGGGFELLDVVPFADESRNFVGLMAGEGRDGRRALDLTRLTSKALVTPIDQFFVRTRHPLALGPTEGWKVSIEGLVENPQTLDLDQIEAMAVPLGAQLLECADTVRVAVENVEISHVRIRSIRSK